MRETVDTASRPGGREVLVELLGDVRVTVGGAAQADDAWPSRRAQELVALLALAEGHRLPRDAVVEALWPHLGAQAGAANLRKAAHHARQALGAPEAVVLRAGTVALFPGHDVLTDVDRVAREGRAALAAGDAAACARIAASAPGDLLPASPYEAWTQGPRRRHRALLAELLEAAGDLERLAELEPTDEATHRRLMEAELRTGRRHAAIRWYEHLRVALARELGARPDAETQALYGRCVAGAAPTRAALVGRDLELAAAAPVLEHAAAGGGAILVQGPTGIGKSAFCRELADRAEGSGWRVVPVTCAAAGPPYAPVADVVEQLAVLDRDALADLPERTRTVLTELTPVAGPAPAATGTLTRHQVIASLRRLLTVGGPDAAPTLLLLEDAHRCDAASADVLHQLVVGSTVPVLVLAARRDDRPGDRTANGLDELAAAAGTLVLELGPLPPDATAALVGATASARLDPSTRARIVDAAGGNPFFALELARGAVAGATTRTLPDTVRAAITRRYVDLDRPTMDALTTLAVAGDELDLASVLALTGLDEGEAFALLDTALSHGVLVVVGTRYRFAHDLVRQSLTDGLAPHRRLALHREAARRLVEADGAPELIAQHWLDGDRPAEAVLWLLAAARRAAGLGGFADALVHVDRLLAADPAHVEALCLRAEVLDALGDNRAPDAYADAARAAGEPGAQDLRARQALAQIKASDPAGALRTLEGTTPTTPVGLLAQALTLSAAAAIGWYADAETAAAKADEAHRLAVEIGDSGGILDATWAHALAAHAKGELPARLREYLRSTSALPELATRVFDGQLCVTERMLYGGLPSGEIIAFADALAAEAQRLGAARGHAFALTLRGEVEILAGRVDDAERDFAEGARLHGRIGAIAGEALSLLGRAQVAVHHGRRTEAELLLADALLKARESEVGHHTLDRIYGTMVAAAADPDAAVAVVREAETAIRGPAETCPTCRIAFIVPAAIAAARAGDVERARHYGAACETAIEVIALPPAWSAAVDEVRGWIARADGDLPAARAHFARAAEGFATWEIPLEAERCAALAVG